MVRGDLAMDVRLDPHLEFHCALSNVACARRISGVGSPERFRWPHNSSFLVLV